MKARDTVTHTSVSNSRVMQPTKSKREEAGTFWSLTFPEKTTHVKLTVRNQNSKYFISHCNPSGTAFDIGW